MRFSGLYFPYTMLRLCSLYLYAERTTNLADIKAILPFTNKFIHYKSITTCKTFREVMTDFAVRVFNFVGINSKSLFKVTAEKIVNRSTFY